MSAEWTQGPALTAEQIVAWFNETHPIGTSVTYWPGTKGSEARRGRTRSDAWVLPSGQPVVAITGYAGGIHLGHTICATHTSHAIEVPA